MILHSFSADSAAGEVIGQVLRYGQNFRLGVTGGFDDRMVSHHVVCLLGPVTFVSGWATGYLLKWTENSTGMGSISGLIIVSDCSFSKTVLGQFFASNLMDYKNTSLKAKE